MTEVETIAGRIRRWETIGPQGPFTMEIYPTLRCNLDCAFCDSPDRFRTNPRELAASRQLALLEEASHIGVRRVFVLGGGEPLAARELATAMLLKIKELGMEGVLGTNGTLLGHVLQERLLEVGWDEIHFSLDSPEPAVHDLLRGSPGSFRRTVAAICRITARKLALHLEKPRLTMHFVITSLNFMSLEQMIRLAAALGVRRVDFDALIPYQPAHYSLQLTPRQQVRLPEIAARALRLARRFGVASTLENYTTSENIRRGERMPTLLQAPVPRAGSGTPWLSALRNAPCLRPWHYLVVQPDGSTSPCCVLAGSGGSLAHQSLRSLWEGDPFMEQLRRAMKAGKPMARCKECSPNILVHEHEIRGHL